MFGRIIELTAVLIGMFLIITNAGDFSRATAAVGNLYLGAVQTLQGRGNTTTLAA